MILVSFYLGDFDWTDHGNYCELRRRGFSSRSVIEAHAARKERQRHAVVIIKETN